MREISVRVTVQVDARDVNVECSTASAFCAESLQCEDCPFNEGVLTLAGLINEYTFLLAEVKNAAD